MKMKKYLQQALIAMDIVPLEEVTEYPVKPSSTLLKKEAFEKLSNEAYETILLILETPFELFQDLFTDNWSLFSRKRLRKFLRKRNGWSMKHTKKVLNEIKKCVENICDES